MLILSRNLQQKIMIGDDIKIVVVELGNYAVKLGIQAPLSMPIYREEIYWKIKNNSLSLNQESVKLISSDM